MEIAFDLELNYRESVRPVDPDEPTPDEDEIRAWIQQGMTRDGYAPAAVIVTRQ